MRRVSVGLKYILTGVSVSGANVDSWCLRWRISQRNLIEQQTSRIAESSEPGGESGHDDRLEMLAWRIRALWLWLQTSKVKAGIKSCRQHLFGGKDDSEILFI